MPKSIHELLQADTEEELDRMIKSYEHRYPYQGYDTRVQRRYELPHSEKPWVAMMSRWDSCDQEIA